MRGSLSAAFRNGIPSTVDLYNSFFQLSKEETRNILRHEAGHVKKSFHKFILHLFRLGDSIMRRVERWMFVVAIAALVFSPWNSAYAGVTWGGDATYDVPSYTFYVGGSSPGTLTIDLAGTFNSTLPADIGRDSGVGGTVTVDGAGRRGPNPTRSMSVETAMAC
jgi:hypothetical protein